MPPVIRFAFALAGAAAALAEPLRAADLAFPPPVVGAPGPDAPAAGGGFRVARIPVRPPPQRYDVYGYPLFPGVPSPLGGGDGCPPALQPDYDAAGNLAGYAPIPMCR